MQDLVKPQPSMSQKELETAFNLFNSLSVRLEEAYGDLERKVESLDAELREARQEREAQRAEKERIAERLAGLLAELPVGVVVVTAQGTIEEANQAAIDMLDGPLVGSNWNAVVASSLPSAPSSNELVSRHQHRITLTKRQIDGSASVIVLTDVTEVHDLQERLARNQRLSEMGEMGARLAHQIRTPVAAAMLYASGMVSTGSTDTRRTAGKILERLRHLESTIDDMLVFAKGGGGELTHVAPMELVCLAYRTLHPRTQRYVSIPAPSDLADLRLLANQDTLAGALVNLVMNAIESGAEHVVMRARRCGPGHVELVVSDDGPGIQAALAEKIFAPFFTTRTGGTGLGLAVVRSVAQAHSGSVQVSCNDSGGATFCIRLPVDVANIVDTIHTDSDRLQSSALMAVGG